MMPDARKSRPETRRVSKNLSQVLLAYARYKHGEKNSADNGQDIGPVPFQETPPLVSAPAGIATPFIVRRLILVGLVRHRVPLSEMQEELP